MNSQLPKQQHRHNKMHILIEAPLAVLLYLPVALDDTLQQVGGNGRHSLKRKLISIEFKVH